MGSLNSFPSGQRSELIEKGANYKRTLSNYDQSDWYKIKRWS